MSPRPIISWTVRVAVVAGFSFVLLELLMIVLDPYLFKGLYEYDPEMGFRARSYFPTGLGLYGKEDDGTTTNQFGFNDRDYSLQKPPGTFRIVVVGDSFGWAGGREGNYTAILERNFEQRDGSHKIDVISAGYPGTHTGEQLIMLRKFGLQYNPDMVILGFFAGNDFFDADPNRKRIVLNSYFFDLDKRSEHRLLGYPIVGNSRLWLFLKNTFESFRLNRQAKREGDEWATATGEPTPRRNLPLETYYGVQMAKLGFFNRKTSSVRFAANTKYIFESLSEMNDLLKSRGIKFMVAIYPDELQVSETQFKALVDRFQLAKEDYDLSLAQNLLQGFLEAKQIPYLDMLDRFRSEEKKRELYVLRNTHWNDAGNELAAQILYEYLNTKLPVPLSTK